MGSIDFNTLLQRIHVTSICAICETNCSTTTRIVRLRLAELHRREQGGDPVSTFDTRGNRADSICVVTSHFPTLVVQIDEMLQTDEPRGRCQICHQCRTLLTPQERRGCQKIPNALRREPEDLLC